MDPAQQQLQQERAKQDREKIARKRQLLRQKGELEQRAFLAEHNLSQQTKINDVLAEAKEMVHKQDHMVDEQGEQIMKIAEDTIASKQNFTRATNELE